MPYSNKEFKESNINYLNKDFDSFKANLIEYAKTYFPNSYKDFNETSPGMMLIEMSAYVGDVLSFYIDQQYKEMMLPLSQERRNIINIAKMLGYKVKPTIPAHVELTITQQVDATADINDKRPDYAAAVIIDKGLQIQSSDDSNVVFETLEPVDFTVSSSLDTITPVESEFDADGIVSKYTITRKVRAISGETKTKDFTIASPQQYLKLSLPESDVIEIIKCEDVNNGNRWYEVDYLAQDKIPIETFHTDSRTSAYHDISGNVLEVPIPYTLQYIKTGKRFITEIDDENITSLVFGNGVLRRGDATLLTDNFIDLGDAHINTPGDPDVNNLDINLDPREGDSRMTLGETPSNTTMRITYRTGGGIESNTAAGTLTTPINLATKYISAATTAVDITNEESAYGGNSQETVEEIRHKAKQFFASQNRCVTKEDFEARVLSMPPRLGSIAKVFARRTGVDVLGSEINEAVNNLDFDASGVVNDVDIDLLESNITNGFDVTTQLDSLRLFVDKYQDAISKVGTSALSTIDLFVLGYDQNKNLVYLPPTDNTPHPIKQNIINYLSNYRMVTDQINILDGKIINFGVGFSVVAHRSANKSDVKMRCINKITEYFDIDKLQFRQPIYSNDLEYQLMGLEGVRSVNFVQMTQDFQADLGGDLPGLPADVRLLWDFNSSDQVSGNINGGGYGYQYNFRQFYDGGEGFVAKGVVLPSVEPSVFELKNPKQNIRGVVI